MKSRKSFVGKIFGLFRQNIKKLFFHFFIVEMGGNCIYDGIRYNFGGPFKIAVSKRFWAVFKQALGALSAFLSLQLPFG